MRFSFGTLDVAVEEAGSGEPVVMVHSSGMSSRQWRALSGLLAPTHRTLALDLPGCGATTGFDVAAPFDHRGEARLVAALVRSLGRPAHLVGHSYGGFLALLAARELRGLVRSIAAYEPVAFGVVFDAQDAPAIADLGRLGPDFFRDEGGGDDAWFHRFIDWWNGDGAWSRLPDAQRAAFLAVGRKVFLEVRSLCGDRTPRAAYGALDVPALILCGETTQLAEKRTTALLADALPQGMLEIVPGVGHMGILQRAEDVCGRIARHVRQAT